MSLSLLRPVAPLIMAVLLSAPGAAATAAEEADAPFQVNEFRVQGNTLLPSRTIEKTVYPFLGPDRSIQDVDQARTALEEAYRTAGYPTVFVDVPEQNVTGGVVRLNVTEAKVSRLKVTGARYYSNGWIRDQVPEVAPGAVPRIGEFQGQLAAFNARSPDRSLTPVLRPGAAPGTVEVELKVKDELPLHGNLEVNNRQTVDTTPTRLNAGVRYDNLWQRDHSIGFQYQVAPEEPDETRVYALTYVARPEDWQTSLVFYGVINDSDIATFGGDINVIGQGTVLGFRAVVPLPGDLGFYQSFSAGFDYKDFKDQVGFDAEGEEDITTPIDYVNWTAAYNATLAGESRTQAFSAAVNLGIRRLFNESNCIEENPIDPGSPAICGEFEEKRANAQPNYFFLTAGYDLNQNLPWSTSLFLSLATQFSAEPLISNEQFAAGGLDSVRGYYEAEQLGDYGYRGSLELRSPDFARQLWQKLDLLQGFVFTDGAIVRLRYPLPGQENQVSLSSVGVGLRLAGLGMEAGLDWALPLSTTSATEDGDSRVLFSVAGGF